MMDNKTNKTKNTNGSQKEMKFCGCFTPKCGVISASVILICDFIFEIVQIILISLNPYFDTYFWVVYLLLLIPLVYAISIFIEYYLREESPETRKRIPEAFIFAAIASFSIVFWIFIYVAVIYPYEKVYVSGQDRYEPDTAQP